MDGLNDLVRLLKRPPAVDLDDARERRRSYWYNTLHIEYRLDRFQAIGSGLLISPTGYFLTNLHVLNGKQSNVTVQFQDDNYTYDFPFEKVLVKSTPYDLVLAKCSIPSAMQKQLQEYMPVVLAHQTPALDEELRIYGFKYDAVEERTGKLLGQNGKIRKTSSGSLVFQKLGGVSESMGTQLWLSDAKVEQGFSGGPVVRAANGELLGITTIMAMHQRANKVHYEHGYISAQAVRCVVNSYLKHYAPEQVEQSISQENFLSKLRRYFNN